MTADLESAKQKKNRYPDTYLFGSAFSQNYRIRTRILLDPNPHISRSGSAYIRIRIKANSSMIQIRSSMVGRIRIRNPGLLCTRLVYPYTSHKSSFKHSPIYTFSIRMREGRGGENAMASKAIFLMDKDHLLTCFVPRSDKNQPQDSAKLIMMNFRSAYGLQKKVLVIQF